MPTQAERKIYTANRKAQLNDYRKLGHFIPNDENWGEPEGKYHDYRLYRQSLNAYLRNTGKPWLGGLSDCLDLNRGLYIAGWDTYDRTKEYVGTFPMHHGDGHKSTQRHTVSKDGRSVVTEWRRP